MISIYIHWPFCKSKCPYCDFNSHVRDSIDFEGYKQAYMREINYFRPYIENQKIKSIFFGGGTPSTMPSAIVDTILNQVNKVSTINNETEITLEANPTSFETNKFKSFKQSGVNRLSLGIQSIHDKYLKFLGREHSAEEALSALDKTREIFENYSFDLIYCLPQQTIEEWRMDLEKIVQIADKHISLYQLTIEKGTKFYSEYKNKKFELPDDDIAADMYNFTDQFLEDRDFENYEISNYAKKGFESQHNLTYWHYEPYVGIGAGAHSRLHESKKIMSSVNIHSPENWKNSVLEKENAIQGKSTLSSQQIAQEKLMMGLRLKKGIDISHIQQFINQSKLEQLISLNFLEIKGSILNLTKKGKLVLNRITSALLN